MPTETNPNQLELVISDNTQENLGFKITADLQPLVIIDGEMSLDKFRIGLKALKQVKGQIRMAEAAYINWGIVKFGKEIVETELSQLEFDLQDVKSIIAIGTIPPDIYQPHLNADHYIVLARAELTDKQRAKWAKKASDQRLSPAQLKASIRMGEVVSGTQTEKTHGLVSLVGIRQDFDIWYRRVKGVAGIKRMEFDAQKEVISDLKPFHELYLKLDEAMKAPKPAKKAKAKK